MGEPLFGGYGKLIVRVTDADRGGPVDGARVWLQIASEPLDHHYAWTCHEGVAVGRTDARGVLEIDGLHSHRYLLDVDAAGFIRHISATRMLPDLPEGALPRGADVSWHTLTIGHWDPAWAEALGDLPAIRTLLPVVPPGDVVEVEVRLPRGKLLEGLVRDPEGRPLAEVRVSVQKQEVVRTHASGWRKFFLVPNEPVFSDASGRFVLTVHPAARVLLRADVPGHVPEQKDIDLSLEGDASPEFVLRRDLGM